MPKPKWKETAIMGLQAADLELSDLRTSLVMAADTPEETEPTRDKIAEIEDMISDLLSELGDET